METGLATQIGFAAESAYGTRVAPTRFLDLIEEGIAFDPGRRESKSIRANKRVLLSERWQPSKKAAAGTVRVPLLDKGLGLLLQHALGSILSSQPDLANSPTVWEHKAKLGNPFGQSLSCQVGRASTDGTVNPFDYVGGKVAKWTISQALDDDAILELDLDFQDEDTAQTLAVASYPTDAAVLGWDNLAVTVNGQVFNASSLTLTGENALKTDRYFAGARTKKEPLANDLAVVTCELEGEFEDTTAYELVRSGTEVAVTANWTGRVAEDAFHFAVEVSLASCRVDGTTPQAGGPDEIPQRLTLKSLDDGSADAPIAIVYRTTDTAP